MPADQQDRTSPLASRAQRVSSRDVAAALLSLAAVLGPSPALAQATKPSPPAASAAPVKLDTVTARRGDIQQTVDATGKLQLHTWADAYAQIGGQVKEVSVAIGDTVQADQALLDITPTQQPAKVESNRAQMARLQADLADQRAQLEFAQLQFKRQTQLKAQNATREDVFESARMNASSANARVDAITAQIHELEATLKIDEEARQKTIVRSPISGTVVSMAVRTGQMVAAAQPAAPLLRIADLSEMTVAALVAESDVTRLRPGMAASFTTPGYPGKHWSGKLRQVIPVPADGTGEQGKQAFYTVLFEVKNPDHELMSGMSAQVQFVVAQARDTLLLPANGLGAQDEDGQYNVNVLDAGQHVGARKVKVGLRNVQQVQILSGLAAGDKVLVGPVPNVLATPAGPDAGTKSPNVSGS
ncbi:efflux RND transporter periplasmic adaptor subunit [Massilia pinisoli]|uniref:Efflux RND transporter periplasmic adaptor subunit n=1 Tax=Massilia pinisoli TaxID=1772194 RepID=A0ABT1ZLA0_9BURK|nr:efflux RND transporter periplasmic adaptor subunit [Massilia pinisoli]MCS0580701.1 efflux RND transporter periplasmic adaptor subunit [Massilia pinisoli]